ncbi:AraC family transcriptional regulator [Pleomorphomonas sp. PLEO]|uniref:AraC family transcriptional regulator n=1 Tax=Pleomorphomonas sp. PLEO TaxID=3239306 RepID=UPI00351EE4CC
MDPLSDLLRLLKIRSYGAAGLDAGGDWAIQFPVHDGIKFFAVVEGMCSLWLDEEESSVEIRAGECFLATQGLPFRIAGGMAVEPLSLEAVLPPAFDGRVVTINGGGDFLAVGGFFALASGQAHLLFGAMPPVVRFREGQDREVMAWCVDRLASELRTPRAGTSLLAQQLVTMMLVQALRASIADASHPRTGWLAALADTRLRAAVGAMHAEPHHRWTLQSLAVISGMSRTSFALKFRAAMGIAPLDYLTRWRMLLAQDRLATSQESAAEIGLAIGYDCERSFARAFKRMHGCSPRQYRLTAQSTQPTTRQSSI